ncbi:PDDEXK family nuclease [Amycolatopsis thermophila]|uniref:DUF1330 domain-containing protein n=1 Tax=Amycolatopsis thermophila TaxID=206084 RepID=A0ABU0EY88_9PSEU|nr:hypothetical protein [Amycolatopsis thermophila]MDQ0379825.1 hypothetical protein [Amycolatopsis thermophila]
MTVTFLLLVRLSEDGAAAFDAYEDSVLPLLAEYGGRLERRVRSLDDRTEAHLVSFPGEQEFGAYRDDPRRAAATPSLARSGAVVELLPVRDLTSRSRPSGR